MSEILTVVIKSDEMGSGDVQLGKTLLKGYIYSITKLDKYPSYILIYNKGVNLVNKDSDFIQDLLWLQKNNTKILCCGTCIEFYKIDKDIDVGEVTNMYTIAQVLASSDNIIYP